MVVTQHEQRPHPDCTPGQILGGLKTLHEDMQPLALLSCSVAPPTKGGTGEQDPDHYGGSLGHLVETQVPPPFPS